MADPAVCQMVKALLIEITIVLFNYGKEMSEYLTSERIAQMIQNREPLP